MIDIEDRLRRDAAQCRRTDGPAPSLDDLLVRTTAAPRPRNAALWLSVAAAVAVAGLVVALAVRPWSGSHNPPAGPPPTKVRTLIDNMVPSAAVLETPRGLDLWLPCSATDIRAHVHETGSAVQVRVSGYAMLPRHGQGTHGYQCTTAPTRVRVQLAAPLRARTVQCPCAPPAVPVLRRYELPEPGHLPAGYLPAGVEPINPAAGRLVGQRDYRRGTDKVSVLIGAASQLPAASQAVAGHVPVGRHDAVITDAAGTCVSWPIRAGVQEAVCSVGHPDSPLPTAEVVKIARSLP